MRRNITKGINNNEPINPFHIAHLFYSIEALKVAIMHNDKYKDNPLAHSSERLMNDIESLQNTIEPQIAKMIYDYSVLACYGELKHSNGIKCKYRVVSTSKTYRTVPSDDRIKRYDEALLFNDQSIISASKLLFKEDWRENFGGEAWFNIANHVSKYNKFSNHIFIDGALSLSHNCGHYINKQNQIFDVELGQDEEVFCLNNGYVKYLYSIRNYIGMYKNLLDMQAETKLPHIFLHKSIFRIYNNCYVHPYHKSINNSLCMTIDKSFKKLLQRAFNLRLINNCIIFDQLYKVPTIDICQHIMNYKPIKWGNQMFSNKKRLAVAKNEKEEKIINGIKCGMKCKFSNENIASNMFECKNEFKNFTIVNISHFKSMVEVSNGIKDMRIDIKYIVYINDKGKEVKFPEKKKRIKKAM